MKKIFEKGDTVTIKSWDKMVKQYGIYADGCIDIGGDFFVESMKKYCGNQYTIDDSFT